ncbi:hypothetical protein B0H19DRAFT_1247443 [Mycena capillaripes]|nr:hypothetical protein B0H19DRAFT_1247443 [Mycena capillaripes]
MNYTIDSTTFDYYWDYALSQTYGACAAALLYGVLLVLSGISANLLYHRTGAGRKTLAIATSGMAILATLQLVFYIRVTVLDLHIVHLRIEGDLLSAASALSALSLYDRLAIAEGFLLVTNNLVTDSLLIYRCFIIWGRNVRIIILPILMLLVTTVLGSLTAVSDVLFVPYHVDARIAYAMVLLTNVVLTALTAGRIWWIRRDACIVLESAHIQKYNTAIGMIVESGAIYCLTVIIYLITISIPNLDNSPVSTIVRAALPQIMNIAPILIIVQVGLGRSVGDTVTEQGREPFPRLRTAISAHASASELRDVLSSLVLDIGVADKKDVGEAISRTELEKGF